MAEKGSLQNPYTTSEYDNLVSSNAWRGGWVEDSDVLIYHSQSLSTYAGCCRKSRPVSYMLFLEMRDNGIWTGGWFYSYQNQITYRDSNGTEYDSSLGTMDNPCPLTVYDEMIFNKNWEGGWIQESGGLVRYAPSFSASLQTSGCGCGDGSGSGSGSGSGCGSGSSSGSGSGSGEGSGSSPGTSNKPVYSGMCEIGELTYNDVSVAKITLSWSVGNTAGQQDLSVIDFSLVFTNPDFILLNTYVNCYWDNEDEYKISFNGYIVVNHHSLEDHCDIYGNFIVPKFYRERDK